MRFYPAFIVILAVIVAIAISSWAADIHEYGSDDVRILRISDKEGGLKPEILVGDKEIITRSLPEGICPNEFVTFMVLAPEGPCLIDTGWGETGGGQTLSLLNKSGYKPEEIKKVFLTHLHPDHVGGMVNNGEKVFPNAKVYVDSNEYEYWLKNSKNDSFSKPARDFLNTYKDDIVSFKDPAILPWLKFLPSPGHTPGHGTFVIDNANQEYIIGGDIFHCLQVQAAHPEITVIYDIDQDMARKSRKEFLQNASRNGSIVLGGHFPAPGAVRFTPGQGNGYDYTPVQPK